MALAHLNASTAPRAFAFRVLAALVLAALCAFALSSCGHEPEIATPPADYGQEQQNNTEKNTGAQDNADDATAADDEASEQDDTSAEHDASDGAAAQATHEGPFVVRILNTQNATWQGEIFWAERQRLQTFRSALELLKLFQLDC